MGIASAGGAGRALAEWIVEGTPTLDLWPVDFRRFARFNTNAAWLHDRVKESLGLHYAMPWPNRELETARPLRRSALFDRLDAKGAVFGSKMGWERPNWFAAAGGARDTVYAFGRQNWHDDVAREVAAARGRVALFDQTSFGKLLVQGRDAASALNRLCAADVDVAPGRTIYTGMLNPRGGYESDLTVLRRSADEFLLITGTAQPVRDRDWILRNLPSDAHVTVADVTSAYAVIGVMGPQARTLLARISPADLSNDAFAFATHREIDLGQGIGIANRMSYVGELGWELIIPTEFAAGVYDALCAAGADLGLADAGYYALEAMRLEKGFRAWSRELTPDITPYEAGLGFAVALDKDEFIGRDALLAARAAGAPLRRIVQITLEDERPMLWGGEAVLRDGVAVGDLRSAFYGFTLGRAVGLGLVLADRPIDAAYLETGRWEIDLAGEKLAARVHLRPAYDPSGARTKA